MIAEELRLGLRRLAKAVVVIACRTETGRHAMTATAVSELSFDPPSLLACVNRSASMYPALEGGADFSINILHHSHEPIANLCAGAEKGEARFASGDWDEIEDVPYLRDAQASFLCRNVNRFDHGTHGIFIGNVMAVHTAAMVDPLIYVDRRYSRITALNDAD